MESQAIVAVTDGGGAGELRSSVTVLKLLVARRTLKRTYYREWPQLLGLNEFAHLNWDIRTACFLARSVGLQGMFEILELRTATGTARRHLLEWNAIKNGARCVKWPRASRSNNSASQQPSSVPKVRQNNKEAPLPAGPTRPKLCTLQRNGN